MINPIAIAMNNTISRKQVSNIIGSRINIMRKAMKSVAQIFAFF